MATKTLLDIIQNVMIAMGDDPINSIEDSPESEDLAVMAKGVFEEIITWDEWPDTFKIASLDYVSDYDCPVALKINDDFRYIESVEYFIEDRNTFRTLDYYTPPRFLDATNWYFNDTHHIKVKGYGIDSSFVPVLNNKDPQYYTTFDDKHIITNSYDYERESNLQESNCRVWVCVVPDFKIEDNFILNYQQDLINLFISELKVAASYYMNQQDNPRDRKQTLRILNKLRRYKGKVINEQEESWPNGVYGRNGRSKNIRKMGRR